MHEMSSRDKQVAKRAFIRQRATMTWHAASSFTHNRQKKMASFLRKQTRMYVSYILHCETGVFEKQTSEKEG